MKAKLIACCLSRKNQEFQCDCHGLPGRTPASTAAELEARKTFLSNTNAAGPVMRTYNNFTGNATAKAAKKNYFAQLVMAEVQVIEALEAGAPAARLAELHNVPAVDGNFTAEGQGYFRELAAAPIAALTAFEPLVAMGGILDPDTIHARQRFFALVDSANGGQLPAAAPGNVAQAKADMVAAIPHGTNPRLAEDYFDALVQDEIAKVAAPAGEWVFGEFLRRLVAANGNNPLAPRDLLGHLMDPAAGEHADALDSLAGVHAAVAAFNAKVADQKNAIVGLAAAEQFNELVNANANPGDYAHAATTDRQRLGVLTAAHGAAPAGFHGNADALAAYRVQIEARIQTLVAQAVNEAVNDVNVGIAALGANASNADKYAALGGATGVLPGGQFAEQARDSLHGCQPAVHQFNQRLQQMKGQYAPPAQPVLFQAAPLAGNPSLTPVQHAAINKQATKKGWW